jgi:DNA polymerase IV
MSQPDLRKAALRCLPGGVAPDPRDFRRVHADHRAALSRRGLSRRHQNLKGIGSATQIAETIRAKIRTETGLTASAGVSYNKFLAKLASDHRKPDGLFVITPKMGPAFVERLPVEKFHGVGPATAAKMDRLGIKTGFDLREQALAFLQQHFGGSRGHFITGSRAASTNGLSEPTGSASLLVRKTPFPPISSQFEAACKVLQPIIEKVWRTCEGAEIRGRTVTLKVKYADFQQIRGSRTGQALFSTRAEIEQLSYALLEPLWCGRYVMPGFAVLRYGLAGALRSAGLSLGLVRWVAVRQVGLVPLGSGVLRWALMRQLRPAR